MGQNDFLILMSDQAHPVSAMAAHIIAGAFVLWVIALFWEGLLFKRIVRDPVVGKTCSAAAAWATLFLIRMETPYTIPGVIRDFDLPALAMLLGLAIWSGLRMRAHILLEDDQA